MRDINFFSPYINVKKTSKEKHFYGGLALVLVIAVVGGFTTMNIVKEKQLKKEIIAVQAEVSNKETAKKLQNIEDKKIKIELLTKHYETVKKINAEINQIDIINSSLLKTISDALPQETFIKGMSINTNGIQFQGGSNGRVAIAELEYNLKQTHLFYEVHVNIINQDVNDSGNSQFNIECTFFKDVKKYEADQ